MFLCFIFSLLRLSRIAAKRDGGVYMNGAARRDDAGKGCDGAQQYGNKDEGNRIGRPDSPYQAGTPHLIIRPQGGVSSPGQLSSVASADGEKFVFIPLGAR